MADFSADQEIIASFIEEGFDLLNVWEETVLHLEGSFDASNLNKLFRVAHNIKGAAKTIGLEQLGFYVHTVEDVINAIRENTQTFSKEHVEFFLEAHKVLLSWLERISVDNSYVHDVTSLLNKASQLKGVKELKFQIPCVEHLTENLVVSNLDELLKASQWDQNRPYIMMLDMEMIDTAGAQLLVALKKNYPLMQIKTHKRAVLETLKLLGLSGVVL